MSILRNTFKVGDRVAALSDVYCCVGGGICLVKSGTLGTVRNAYSQSCKVEFDRATNHAKRYLQKSVQRVVWFSESISGSYPSLERLSLVGRPQTLEGRKFTVVKENTDGTMVVRCD